MVIDTTTIVFGIHKFEVLGQSSQRYIEKLQLLSRGGVFSLTGGSIIVSSAKIGIISCVLK